MCVCVYVCHGRNISASTESAPCPLNAGVDISVSSSDLDQSPKLVGVQSPKLVGLSVLDPGAPAASTSADTQTTTVDQPTESATLDTSYDTKADENVCAMGFLMLARPRGFSRL